MKTTRRSLAVLSVVFLVAACAQTITAQVFQELYDFNDKLGGYDSIDLGQLTQGSDGNLYGTAHFSSSQYGGYGSIFQVTPSGTHTDLYFFDGRHGAYPQGALTLASDGNFYGAAFIGGTRNNGTIFRFTPPGTLTVLHNFTGGSDGKNPSGPPVQGKDGNLYGVTAWGTLYRVELPTGTFKHFSSGAPGDSISPLYLASDGNLYGTSFDDGLFGSGTVFRMTTAGAITTVYSFTGGSDGSSPTGPLTQASDGNLYGTTQSGGANGDGSVFMLTLSGQLTSLYSFDPVGPGSTNTDGWYPWAGVLAASDGNIYGTNLQGGAYANGFDGGTLYVADKSGSAFDKLVDFSGTDGPYVGSLPYNTLMQHTNGCLYGVTRVGGFYGSGAFYSMCHQGVLVRTVKIAGPIFVLPGVPVEILGENLADAYSVSFGPAQAQFQPGSETFLVAQVPANAVDGLVTVTLASGEQVESQTAVHILPVITNLDPSQGTAGLSVHIVGGGFSGTTKVTFGGKAANFTVLTPAMIQAIVPPGAKSGKVVVTTPNGTATSPQKFLVN